MDKERLLEVKSEKLRKKEVELGAEQKRLDERSGIQNKEKASAQALRKECDKVSLANKKEADRLKKLEKKLSGDEGTLFNRATDLDKREQDVEVTEAAVEDVIIKIEARTQKVASEEKRLKEENQRIKKVSKEQEAFQYDLIGLKSSYISGGAENEMMKHTLQTTERRLRDQESNLVRAEKELKDRRIDLNKRESTALIDKSYLDNQSEDINQKTKEYFRLKRETLDTLAVIEGRKVSVEKRESQSIKIQSEIKKDKESISVEKERLSAWSIELKEADQDLKDRQRLLKIEERALSKRENVIKKLRNSKEA